jgi:osmotically inducible protein OsmC
MPVRTAEGIWEGDLEHGRGRMSVGPWSGTYSFASRMQTGPGTNPEELLAAAHAGCFSMALAAALQKAGHSPDRIATTTEVTLDKVGEGYRITGMRVRTRVRAAGLETAALAPVAEEVKRNCPVARALSAVPATLDAAVEE